jgi:hypothetical protein
VPPASWSVLLTALPAFGPATLPTVDPSLVPAPLTVSPSELVAEPTVSPSEPLVELTAPVKVEPRQVTEQS